MSDHDQINLIFRPRHHQLTTTSYRHSRSDAFATCGPNILPKWQHKNPLTALSHSTFGNLAIPNKVFDLSTIIKYALLAIIPTYIGYVILTFFNFGLITCAFIRLCGDDLMLADGFSIAWKRLPQILTWSMLAATVGLILRSIKGRNNFIGSMISGMLGFGWRIASFFAVPVIVAEEKGAIDALKRSAELVKKNWGEAITLKVGLSVLAIPATLPFFLIAGLAASVWATSPVLGASLIVIGIVYVFLGSLVFSTLDAIAKAALYMFASGDQMPQGFNNEILETIFKRNGVGSPALA